MRDTFKENLSVRLAELKPSSHVFDGLTSRSDRFYGFPIPSSFLELAPEIEDFVTVSEGFDDLASSSECFQALAATCFNLDRFSISFSFPEPLLHYSISYRTDSTMLPKRTG